ncbi:hypothetical protein AAMO2058_001027000 [Amorphochlora amoebiformis]
MEDPTLGFTDVEMSRETLIRFYIECINRFNAAEDSEKKTKSQENVNKCDMLYTLDCLMQRHYLCSLSLHELACEVITLIRLYLTHREHQYKNVEKAVTQAAGGMARKWRARILRAKRLAPSMSPNAHDDFHKNSLEKRAESVLLPKMIKSHIEKKYKAQLTKLRNDMQAVKLQLGLALEANNKEKILIDDLKAENTKLKRQIKTRREKKAKTPRSKKSNTRTRTLSIHTPEELQAKNQRISELESELFKLRYTAKANLERLQIAHERIVDLEKSLEKEKKKVTKWRR